MGNSELTELLSANSLYVLANIGGNKDSIPFIPIPEINIDEALEELSRSNYINKELTKTGKRNILAISMIQRYQMCTIINDIAYFYNPDGIQCVAVVTKLEKEEAKYTLIIGNKLAMLLSKLYENKWLHDKLIKKEVIKLQETDIEQLTKLTDGKESFYVTLFINGEIEYNSIFYNNNGSTIKYDVINRMISENSGREYLKELFKTLKMGEEYKDINSYQNNRGI
jgi:hypothetical protein